MGSKVFQSSSAQYHYDPPVSAFAHRGQNFDRPIGQVREMTRRFRVLSLTFMLVAFSLLIECCIQLNKKVPDILVAEQIQGGWVERVVLLPYNEELYLQFCSKEHGDRCVKNGK